MAPAIRLEDPRRPVVRFWVVLVEARRGDGGGMEVDDERGADGADSRVQRGAGAELDPVGSALRHDPPSPQRSS
jgi:hypothetical protein